VAGPSLGRVKQSVPEINQSGQIVDRANQPRWINAPQEQNLRQKPDPIPAGVEFATN
jgi:hypothetical protein